MANLFPEYQKSEQQPERASRNLFPEHAINKPAPAIVQKTVKDPSLWDMWSELVTGAGERAQLPRDVQRLPELSETAAATDPQVLFGMMSTMDVEARKDILRDAIPGVSFDTVNDTTVINFPGGNRAILDKPGLTLQDVSTLSAQTLAYLTPAKFTGMIGKLLPRMAATGVAEGAVNIGLQKGAQALGSEQPTDYGEAAMAGALGAAGELAPAVLAAGGRALSRIPERAAIGKAVREGREDIATAAYTPKKLPEESIAVVDEITEPPSGVIETGMELAKDLPFSPSRVVKSQAAESALYQKVPERLLTRVRGANTETRNVMKTITKEHWQSLQSGDVNPYRTIGKHFTPRLETVAKRQKAAIQQQKAARADLSKIKGEALFDSRTAIANKFAKNLEDNLITLDEAGNLDFSGVGKGSPINKPANKRELMNHFEDFKNAKTAEDLHRVKKNIQDAMNYERRGVKGGFDDKTETLLKNLATDINSELRQLSQPYKEANDVLSKNLDAFKKMEEAIPALKKLDLENPADLQKAQDLIGQEFRKIDSNYSKGVDIQNAIDVFDDLASEYGAASRVDVKRLSSYLNELKLRLGDRSGTYQGKTEAAVRRGSDGFVKDTGRKIMEALEPANEINDKNAYKSILGYINEMNKRAQ